MPCAFRCEGPPAFTSAHMTARETMPPFEVFSVDLLLASLLLAGVTLLLLARESRWRGPALWWAIAHAWALVTAVAYFAHLNGLSGAYAVSAFASSQFAASLLLGTLPQRSRRTVALLIGGGIVASAIYLLLRHSGLVFDGALLLFNIAVLLLGARLLYRSAEFRSNPYGRWLAALFLLRALHDLSLIRLVHSHQNLSVDLLISALFAMANAVLMVLFVHRHQEWLLRRLVRDLDLTRRASERAERTRNALLAGMSHELRTPLNAICGFAQLLEHGDSLAEEKRREYAHCVSEAGTRLTRIIEELLELASIENATQSWMQKERNGAVKVGERRCASLDELFRERWEKRYPIIWVGDSRRRLPDLAPVAPELLEHILDRLVRLVHLCRDLNEPGIRTALEGTILRLEIRMSCAEEIERSLSHVIAGRCDPYTAEETPVEADLSLALVETCAYRLGGGTDLRREGGGLLLVVTIPLIRTASTAA